MRKPPKRRCQSCGGDYYAWQESGICLRCRRSTAGDAAELAAMVREQRFLRRERMAADGLDMTPATLAQVRLDGAGFPEGF